MKKSIVAIVLLLAVAALAYGQEAAPQQTQPAGQQQAPAPEQKKEIKDIGEYNAYVNALKQEDPNQKAIALEGYLQQYPSSVVKLDALEALMGAYQNTRNIPKLNETAQRILQINPNHVTALALLAYTSRAAADSNQNPAQNYTEAIQYAERGLKAMPAWKPEGVSEADLQKQKTALATLFNTTAGFSTYRLKNYPVASKYLRAAIDGNPNATVEGEIFPLAVAELEQQPPVVEGLFFAARAAALSPAGPNQDRIAKYAKNRYIRYHGSDEGWNELLAQAKVNPMPPAGFNIAPAPTPAEQAANLVKTKAVKDMVFDEFQLIFTSGNQAAIDTVWNQLKGKDIAFSAQVISGTPSKLTLSATYDDIEKKIPDVDLTMTAAIPAKLMPKPGTMAEVTGKPESYTVQPFHIMMTDGQLIVKEAPAAKTPAAKTPAKTTKKAAPAPRKKTR